jgi:hypothetical protein
VHFGVATTPFEVSTLRQAKGQGFVFQAAARYAVTQPLSVELGVPWVLGSVAQPAGSYVDAAAVGNPQLGARYLYDWRGSAASVVSLSAELTVGLPLASHAPDLMPNRVLAIANGVLGRGRPDWLTPGALPITPGLSAHWTDSTWTLEGALNLPVLLRTSEADLPAATTNTHAIGLAAIALAEAGYRFTRRCSLVFAEQLFIDVAPLAAYPGQPAQLQDFERLSLQLHLGQSSLLLIDLQTAIAGELGGSTVAGGLRTQIAF